MGVGLFEANGFLNLWKLFWTCVRYFPVAEGGAEECPQKTGNPFLRLEFMDSLTDQNQMSVLTSQVFLVAGGRFPFAASSVGLPGASHVLPATSL